MKTQEDLRSICSRILESDSSIKFVAIPDKMGRHIVSSQRGDEIRTYTAGNNIVGYTHNATNEC
jgi:hypothetical protein